MLLAATFAAMTVIVLATVIAPLLKGARSAPERAAYDRAVYRDQLKELEREAARGLVAPREAAAARLEIERRLLAADATSAGAPPRRAGSPWLAALLALLVAGGSAAVYLQLGSPGVPDEPYAERGAERALAADKGHLDLDKTAAALEEKVKANPQDAESWLLLARTEAALNRWQKSADAYRHAIALEPGRADITAAYGETLVLAAGGIVTPTAHDAFAATLAHDPKSPVARYYLALADAQAGNAKTAIDAWQKLAAEAPANAPVRAQLQRRIADAANSAGLPVPPLAPPAQGVAEQGPSAGEMAAARQLPPEQRQAMIRGMVAKLAAELQSRPDDFAGWMRLGRSYSVLGEADKAADAYEHAAKLKPDDAAIPLAAAEALLAGHKLEDPIPPRVVALLHRGEALDPKAPPALWYLGLAAVQTRHFDEARRYWERLRDVLPADSPDRQTVTAALDSLKGK
jgi:cytochrome c-type biogenesis protein CcmH